MANPKERELLTEAKQASDGSVFNSSNAAYAHSVITEESYCNTYNETGLSNMFQMFPTVSCPPKTGKGKGRSDSLVNDTQPTKEVGESSLSRRNTPASSADCHAQPIHIPSWYFKCTFLNFNSHNVDLNKTGVVYQYEHYYFVAVSLSHHQTSEPTLEYGFIHRENVEKYLVYEWESLTKERIGEWGIALCGDDGRWAIHSVVLQYMRYLCGHVAKTLEIQILQAQKRGCGLDVKTVKAKLSEGFMKVLGKLELDLKKKEKKAAEEADKFMNEFMEFEE